MYLFCDYILINILSLCNSEIEVIHQASAQKESNWNNNKGNFDKAVSILEDTLHKPPFSERVDFIS